MATTCEICKKKIAFWDIDYKTQGMSMHYQCREEFLREPEDDAGKQKKRVEPKEEKSRGIVTEDDQQAGPWSIAKSISSGETKKDPAPELEKIKKNISELTEKEKKDSVAWVPKKLKPLISMQVELAELPDIQNMSTNTDKDSTSGLKAGYALSLGLKEKEIFFFGGMQWLAVAMAYLLWTQMLFWIPPEVWDAMETQDGAGPIDYALTLWAFLCVGLAAFPIGIFSSCMGVTHFLHKQGRASTVAMCLKLSLPNAWRLWAFHWTDGWFTVKQIWSRIPGGENRTLAQILYQEALYYAWKVGISGVLPSMVIGKGMIESGKESVEFVKQNTKEIIKLRAAYSGNCWVLGILTYVAAFPIVFYLDDGTGIGNNIANIYLYIALPICFSTGFIMFFLRPIYLLNLCNLYSDYLKTNNIKVELPDNPPRAMSALVVFAILCVAALVIFYYREAIGLVDILSTI